MAFALQPLATAATLTFCLSLVITYADKPLASAWSEPPDSAAAAEALRSCYNSAYQPNATTFSSYAAGKTSASMRIHRVWWSKRRAVLPFTLFTSTDLGRLQNLDAQCRSLSGGVISAAVYLPLYEPDPRVEAGQIQLSPENLAQLETAAAAVEALFQALESGAPMPASVKQLQEKQQQLQQQQLEKQRPALSQQGKQQTVQAPPSQPLPSLQPPIPIQQQRPPRPQQPKSRQLSTHAAQLATQGRDAADGDDAELLQIVAAAAASRRLSEGEYRRLLKEEVYSFEKVAAKAPRAPPSPVRPPPYQGPPCSLRVTLLYEVVSEEPMIAVFPVNLLRNAGLLGATTPLVSMLDVDLSASWGLTNRVLSDEKRVADMQRRGEDERTVWVLPAFDTEKHLGFELRNRAADEAIALHPEEKQHLIAMWLFRHEILAFNFDSHRRGHNNTNYEKWFTTDSEYTVIYEQAYEPWFIAARKVLPPYDARFRGYGLNKIALGEYMGLSGFNFRVLPDAWIVHRPHDPTPTCLACTRSAEQRNATSVQALSKSVTMKGDQLNAREAFIGRNVKFYSDFRQGMREGKYFPVQDAQSKHCREVLPWWQWGEAEGASVEG